MIEHYRIFLGNIPLSLEIFCNLQKSSQNVRRRLSGLRTTFRETSKIFGKGSEIFGKSPKKSPLVFLYNKQSNTWLLVDKEFLFSCLSLYQVEHSKRNAMST